ncbi:hypothetical protein F4779DRAFT_580958 [Xylariaceae sp. FL0662B]|nr:hypothetical protein F4779DRAFT_580958 [Xylariaceae sp. FL0662B]
MAEKNKEASSIYVPRFRDTLDSVPAPISELLASYSGIPKEAQLEHILKLRNEAYARFPYPCIGIFRFLQLDLASHDAYHEHVLSPLKQPSADGVPEPLFLDLGTGFGQDLRKLAYDGASVHRLWASDIESELIEFGFRMFKDADKLARDRFLCPGDLLSNSPEDNLRVLEGRVTILHVTAVFHLFNLEDQKTIADRCLRLLRKDSTNPVLILGGQAGNAVAGEFLLQNISRGYSRKYRHNGQSWKQLWEDVCGRDEWKNKVEKLELKSKLLPRTRTEVGESGKASSFTQPENYGNMLHPWHMFEVWVTFFVE